MVDEDERAIWLARHVLPHEAYIGRAIRRWRLPDGLDAEDIIQECYAKLAALPSVAHIAAPRVYFLQVARSVLLMHVRRARLVSIDVIADLDDLAISDDAPSPEVRASDREQLRVLARAVVRMGEPHRTIFMLRMLHDLPRFRLPAGAVVLTGFREPTYSTLFANPGTVRVAPAMEIGWLEPGLQRVVANLGRGELDCDSLRLYAFSHLIESTLSGSTPTCLSLEATQGPWRLWRFLP